jgi:hypothetical protein
MTYKSTTLGAMVLYAFSLGFGLLWWLIAWKKGALSYMFSTERSAILLGLAAFQILGWAVAFLLLGQSIRQSPRLPDSVLLGITAGVLCGNLVWLVTPVLGAPLILLISLLGLISLFTWRKRESAT